MIHTLVQWWTFNDTATGFCHDVADFQGLSFKFSGAIGLVGSCATSLGLSSSQNTCTKVKTQTSLSNRKLEKGNFAILDKLRVGISQRTIRAATPWGTASKLKKIPKIGQIPLVFAAKCFVAWVLILCLFWMLEYLKFLIRTSLGFEATNGVAKRSPWHTLTHTHTKYPLHHSFCTRRLLHHTFHNLLHQTIFLRQVPSTPDTFYTQHFSDQKTFTPNNLSGHLRKKMSALHVVGKSFLPFSMFGSRWCDVAMVSERGADFSLALLLASLESTIFVCISWSRAFLLAFIETGHVKMHLFEFLHTSWGICVEQRRRRALVKWSLVWKCSSFLQFHWYLW